MIFFWLLAVSSATLQMVSVTATASLLVGSGPGVLPVLWTLDVAVTLAAVVLVRVLSRRLGNRSALFGITFGFGVLYGLLALAGRGSIPSAIAYVLADGQLAALPTVIWAAAADTLASHQARTMFPRIAAGAAIGNLAGALFGALQPSNGLALGLAAALCLVIMGIAIRTVKKRSRNNDATMTRPLPVSDSVKALREVPALGGLFLQMCFSSLALALLEAAFLSALSHESSGTFATIYGLYRFLLFAAIALASGGLVTRILNRVPAANTFALLPLVLIGGSAVSTFIPTFFVIGLARFAGRFMQRGWDEPSRRTFTALLGDQRRAGITALLDTGSFSLGTLLACILLAVAPALALPGAVFGGIVGFGMALFVRRQYSASILDWRFKKSRRTSILDKIEF